jgi:hypothetical protein
MNQKSYGQFVYARVATALLGSLSLTQLVGAGEMTAKLDCVADSRLLDTHFARYGHAPAKSILREAQGAIRIRLPAATKDVAQTGLYSYVVLAGDFEVSASYEWIAVAPPQRGRGVRCGIIVDTGDTGMSVSLARANLPGKDQGEGYAVTVRQPPGTEPKYKTTHYPNRAKAGRLVLRREKAELVCDVAEGDKDRPRQLCCLPFPEGTVRQVRIYADAGGSPTAVDVRLGQIRIRAEEITGGFARREQPTTMPWWPFVAGSLFVAVVALLMIRRRSGS